MKQITLFLAILLLISFQNVSAAEMRMTKKLSSVQKDSEECLHLAEMCKKIWETTKTKDACKDICPTPDKNLNCSKGIIDTLSAYNLKCRNSISKANKKNK